MEKFLSWVKDGIGKFVLGGAAVAAVAAVAIVLIVNNTGKEATVADEGGQTSDVKVADETADVAGDDVVIDDTDTALADKPEATDDAKAEETTDENEESEETSETETVVLFDGSSAEYECDDLTWLINASDDDVITVVYTCTEADKAGWGILGWGGNVNDVWTDGPSYAADSTDSTKKMYGTITVADLIKGLGAKDASSISFIKLGAWNGGKIISITLSSSEDAKDVAASAGATEATVTVEKETGEIVDTSVTQKVAGLTGSYIKTETEKTDWEFNIASFNSDYEPGDTITITATVEGTAGFSGALGACTPEGSNNYSWKQVDFSRDDAGKCTAVWTGKCTTETAQLNTWWVGDKVGLNVSVAVNAKTSKGSATGTIYGPIKECTIISIPNTCGAEDGDTVRVTATINSEDYFNGTIQLSYATEGYKQNDFEFKNGGSHTVSITLENAKVSSGALQLWWSNKVVGVDSVSMELVGKAGTDEATNYEDDTTGDDTGSGDSGSSGTGSTGTGDTTSDTIHTFTWDKTTNSTDAFVFKLDDYAKDGKTVAAHDTVKVTAILSSTAYFKTVIGASHYEDGKEYGSWGTSDAVESSDGKAVTVTYEFEAANAGAEGQIQLWWANDETITIDSLEVEITKAGETTETSVHTFTISSNKADAFVFKLDDYAKDGKTVATHDTVKVTAVLSSEAYLQAVIGASHYEDGKEYGSWGSSSAFVSNDGSAVTLTYEFEAATAGAEGQIQIWWASGTEVKVESLEVEITKAIVHTFEINDGKTNAFEFNLNDYTVDGSTVSAQDKVKITAILTSASYYGGIIGANHYDASSAYGTWGTCAQTGSGSDAENTATFTYEYEAATDNPNAQIQIWWNDGQDINVESLEVEVTKSGDGSEETATDAE